MDPPTAPLLHHHPLPSPFRRHRLPLPSLAPALLLTLPTSLLVPASAVLMGRLFTTFTAFNPGSLAPDAPTVFLSAVSATTTLLVALGVATCVLSSAWFGAWVCVGEALVRGAREAAFRALMRQSGRDGSEGVESVVVSVTTHLADLYHTATTLGFTLQAATTAVICIGIAASTCLRLTVAILFTLPIALLLLSRVSSGVQAGLRQQQHHLGAATRLAGAALGAVETVKSFGTQQYEVDRYAAALSGAAESGGRVSAAEAVVVAFVRGVTLMMFVQGFWYGGWLVARGEVEAGGVMAVFWACLMGAQAVGGGVAGVAVLQRGWAAKNALEAVEVDEEAEEEAEEGEANPGLCRGDIEVTDVNFTYPSRPSQVLDKLTLTIPANTTTFLLGHSGSGKSTLSALLHRLHSPGSGSITLDGVPLADLNISWLHRNITLVHQRSLLFNVTLYTNIALGRGGDGAAAQREVAECCRLMMLEETIDGLPDGGQTLVGVRGGALSGGQRQRVALARAMIADAPVLILDEATSALDPACSARIMDAVRTQRAGRTTVIITHDTTQIRAGDTVYILEHGRVIDHGPRFEVETRPAFQVLVEAVEEHRSNENDDDARPEKETEFAPESQSGDIELSPLLPARPPVRSFDAQPTLLQIFSTVLPSLSTPERLLLLLGFTAALIHAAATPAFSFALSRLLGTFLHPSQSPSKSPLSAAHWSVAVLAVAAADSVSVYTYQYALNCASHAWINALRTRALTRALLQPRAWHLENGAAAVVLDLEGGGDAVRGLLGQFAGSVFVAAAMAAIGVVCSAVVCVRLTAAGVVIAPVMYVLTVGFAGIVQRWERRWSEAGVEVAGVMEEALGMKREVVALGVQAWVWGRFRDAVEREGGVGRGRAMVEGVGFGVAESGTVFASALIFYYGAVLAADGAYPLDAIITSFTLLLFSLSGAATIISSIPHLSTSTTPARRLLRLYHLPPTSHEHYGHLPAPSPPTALTLHSVSFTYPLHPTPVLRDITLTLPPATLTAIVGSSGSGKSTLAALLLRLYPPSSGTITLGTRDIATLDVRALRQHVVLAPQDPVLFAGSMYENIAYGTTRATSAQVEAAAEDVGLHEWVSSLPDGYSTLVAPGQLSGGQARKVGVARALLRGGSVVVLDEGTAGMDVDAAERVRGVMRRLVAQGVAVVVVTHDVEVMKMAGSVVVLKGGEVVEVGVGGWEEVLARRGELWRLVGNVLGS